MPHRAGPPRARLHGPRHQAGLTRGDPPPRLAVDQLLDRHAREFGRERVQPVKLAIVNVVPRRPQPRHEQAAAPVNRQHPVLSPVRHKDQG